MTLDFTEVNSHRARERGEGDEKSLVCTVPYAKSKQDERTSPFFNGMIRLKKQHLLYLV